MNKITVTSNANIALIKYWGKRNSKLFLPTKSSLSITLDNLNTITSIFLNNKDEVKLDGQILEGNPLKKITSFLDLFRKSFGIKDYFSIETQNNFPTAAGLASSSSGFSSLVLALNKLCKLDLKKKELSILARQASGSSCRSIYDGFVLWNKGEHLNGLDSYAEQIFSKSYWEDFSVLVVILSEVKKHISSRKAMQISIDTCPFYNQWIFDSENKIKLMIEAIKNKDFSIVGQISESDCLNMHKVMQNSKPSINYWTADTIAIMNKVREFRNNGIECYFTIDAGPNVKILTLKDNVKKIRNLLSQISYIKRII